MGDTAACHHQSVGVVGQLVADGKKLHVLQGAVSRLTGFGGFAPQVGVLLLQRAVALLQFPVFSGQGLQAPFQILQFISPKFLQSYEKIAILTNVNLSAPRGVVV